MVCGSVVECFLYVCQFDEVEGNCCVYQLVFWDFRCDCVDEFGEIMGFLNCKVDVLQYFDLVSFVQYVWMFCVCNCWFDVFDQIGDIMEF